MKNPGFYLKNEINPMNLSSKILTHISNQTTISKKTGNLNQFSGLLSQISSAKAFSSNMQIVQNPINLSIKETENLAKQGKIEVFTLKNNELVDVTPIFQKYDSKQINQLINKQNTVDSSSELFIKPNMELLYRENLSQQRNEKSGLKSDNQDKKIEEQRSTLKNDNNNANHQSLLLRVIFDDIRSSQQLPAEKLKQNQNLKESKEDLFNESKTKNNAIKEELKPENKNVETKSQEFVAKRESLSKLENQTSEYKAPTKMNKNNTEFSDNYSLFQGIKSNPKNQNQNEKQFIQTQSRIEQTSANQKETTSEKIQHTVKDQAWSQLKSNTVKSYTENIPSNLQEKVSDGLKDRNAINDKNNISDSKFPQQIKLDSQQTKAKQIFQDVQQTSSGRTIFTAVFQQNRFSKPVLNSEFQDQNNNKLNPAIHKDKEELQIHKQSSIEKSNTDIFKNQTLSEAKSKFSYKDGNQKLPDQTQVLREKEKSVQHPIEEPKTATIRMDYYKDTDKINTSLSYQTKKGIEKESNQYHVTRKQTDDFQTKTVSEDNKGLISNKPEIKNVLTTDSPQKGRVPYAEEKIKLVQDLAQDNKIILKSTQESSVGFHKSSVISQDPLSNENLFNYTVFRSLPLNRVQVSLKQNQVESLPDYKSATQKSEKTTDSISIKPQIEKQDFAPINYNAQNTKIIDHKNESINQTYQSKTNHLKEKTDLGLNQQKLIQPDLKTTKINDDSKNNDVVQSSVSKVENNKIAMKDVEQKSGSDNQILFKDNIIPEEIKDKQTFSTMAIKNENNQSVHSRNIEKSIMNQNNHIDINKFNHAKAEINSEIVETHSPLNESKSLPSEKIIPGVTQQNSIKNPNIQNVISNNSQTTENKPVLLNHSNENLNKEANQTFENSKSVKINTMNISQKAENQNEQIKMQNPISQRTEHGRNEVHTKTISPNDHQKYSLENELNGKNKESHIYVYQNENTNKPVSSFSKEVKSNTVDQLNSNSPKPEGMNHRQISQPDQKTMHDSPKYQNVDLKTKSAAEDPNPSLSKRIISKEPNYSNITNQEIKTNVQNEVPIADNPKNVSPIIEQILSTQINKPLVSDRGIEPLKPEKADLRIKSDNTLPLEEKVFSGRISEENIASQKIRYYEPSKNSAPTSELLKNENVFTHVGKQSENVNPTGTKAPFTDLTKNESIPLKKISDNKNNEISEIPFVSKDQAIDKFSSIPLKGNADQSQYSLQAKSEVNVKGSIRNETHAETHNKMILPGIKLKPAFEKISEMKNMTAETIVNEKIIPHLKNESGNSFGNLIIKKADKNIETDKAGQNQKTESITEDTTIKIPKVSLKNDHDPKVSLGQSLPETNKSEKVWSETHFEKQSVKVEYKKSMDLSEPKENKNIISRKGEENNHIIMKKQYSENLFAGNIKSPIVDEKISLTASDVQFHNNKNERHFSVNHTEKNEFFNQYAQDNKKQVEILSSESSALPKDKTFAAINQEKYNPVAEDRLSEKITPKESVITKLTEKNENRQQKANLFGEIQNNQSQTQIIHNYSPKTNNLTSKQDKGSHLISSKTDEKHSQQPSIINPKNQYLNTETNQMKEQKIETFKPESNQIETNNRLASNVTLSKNDKINVKQDYFKQSQRSEGFEKNNSQPEHVFLKTNDKSSQKFNVQNNSRIDAKGRESDINSLFENNETKNLKVDRTQTLAEHKIISEGMDLNKNLYESRDLDIKQKTSLNTIIDQNPRFDATHKYSKQNHTPTRNERNLSNEHSIYNQSKLNQVTSDSADKINWNEIDHNIITQNKDFVENKISTQKAPISSEINSVMAEPVISKTISYEKVSIRQKSQSFETRSSRVNPQYKSENNSAETNVNQNIVHSKKIESIYESDHKSFNISEKKETIKVNEKNYTVSTENENVISRFKPENSSDLSVSTPLKQYTQKQYETTVFANTLHEQSTNTNVNNFQNQPTKNSEAKITPVTSRITESSKEPEVQIKVENPISIKDSKSKIHDSVNIETINAGINHKFESNVGYEVSFKQKLYQPQNNESIIVKHGETKDQEPKSYHSDFSKDSNNQSYKMSSGLDHTPQMKNPERKGDTVMNPGVEQEKVSLRKISQRTENRDFDEFSIKDHIEINQKENPYNSKTTNAAPGIKENIPQKPVENNQKENTFYTKTTDTPPGIKENIPQKPVENKITQTSDTQPQVLDLTEKNSVKNTPKEKYSKEAEPSQSQFVNENNKELKYNEIANAGQRVERIDAVAQPLHNRTEESGNPDKNFRMKGYEMKTQEMPELVQSQTNAEEKAFVEYFQNKNLFFMRYKDESGISNIQPFILKKDNDLPKETIQDRQPVKAEPVGSNQHHISKNKSNNENFEQSHQETNQNHQNHQPIPMNIVGEQVNQSSQFSQSFFSNRLSYQEITNRIINNLKQTNQQKTHTAEFDFQLNEGSVMSSRIEKKGQDINIVFRMETKDQANIVKQEMQNLEAQLKEMGYQNVNIEYHTSENGHHQQHSSKKGHSKSVDFEKEVNVETTTITEPEKKDLGYNTVEYVI